MYFSNIRNIDIDNILL